MHSAKNHFDSVYARNLVELRHLATHPDFQSQGAGTRLLEWGIKLARTEMKPITVFSSPLGTKLYTKVGFKLLDFVTIQVPGEEEKVSLDVMIYDKHLL